MEPGSSFAPWLFLDPASRRLIDHGDHVAAAAVGALRLEVGRPPEDLRLAALVRELRGASEEVAGWWDDRGVRDHTSADKLLAHPVGARLLPMLQGWTADAGEDPDGGPAAVRPGRAGW